jgi:2-dehydro-3-deoxyphosphogluconate aldolase/(4S)-4-hydroxy-2-oxoglutarate aldolase
MTMRKEQVLAIIKKGGLIPVLRTASADDALSIAEELQQAGLTAVEIPLTVPGAVEVIAELASRFGNDTLVGAGTVLDTAAAAACVAAGARFVISPSLELEVVEYCNEAEVAVMPGALTPTEIMAATRAGADMVKVFPCSAVGGASYIKALKAPLPHIELVPTGGVSLDTAAAFIKAGASALGVGGDLVDVEALRSGNVAVIAERARRYLQIVADARAAR